QFDVNEAFKWMAQSERRAGFAEAMTQLLLGASESDPARAAALIEKSSVPTGNLTIWPVAQFFTQAYPEGAMPWAVRIEDYATSLSATGIVASIWVDSDAQAAERWALRQPAGSARDGILDALAKRRAEAATEQQ